MSGLHVVAFSNTFEEQITFTSLIASLPLRSDFQKRPTKREVLRVFSVS
ncbi:hypothetical protein CCACVL1_06909 [Corchorus capsularis]|uniref:Uncharacterized protein n=1 Tax=Corchorus capsularis TaxID=210143 RepID=A0A1R3JBI7_COCAP|nr:hypothetical protein CCACVL1_06909 [Corchorus capsularis]